VSDSLKEESETYSLN